VDELVDARLLGLDRERIAMRVRHDAEALAARTNGVEKLGRARQEANVLAMLALQGSEIEAEIARPMIEAVPRQLACDRIEARREALARMLDREAVALRVSLRHELEPKEVVEREIEQRAVHVDEHGVDVVPVDETRGCPTHAAMIQD